MVGEGGNGGGGGAENPASQNATLFFVEGPHWLNLKKMGPRIQLHFSLHGEDRKPKTFLQLQFERDVELLVIPPLWNDR
jgi:hypothetical protein